MWPDTIYIQRSGCQLISKNKFPSWKKRRTRVQLTAFVLNCTAVVHFSMFVGPALVGFLSTPPWNKRTRGVYNARSPPKMPLPAHFPPLHLLSHSYLRLLSFVLGVVSSVLCLVSYVVCLVCCVLYVVSSVLCLVSCVLLCLVSCCFFRHEVLRPLSCLVLL